MKLPSTLLLACSLAISAPAWAQPDPEDDLPGDEVEMGEDDAGDAGDAGDSQSLVDDSDGVPGGAEENPDDPSKIGARNQAKPTRPEPAAPYPLEYTRRPIVVFAGMSEVLLDVPVNFDPFYAAGLLQARYGITPRIEAGLRYGVGALDEDGFTTGKTVAVDVTYLVEDFLGVRLSVPLLLDPFSLGVTLGAPMKFRFGKLRFDLGHDLLSIKLKRFVPDVGNARVTAGLVALDATGTTMPDGDIRVLGRVTYQHSPKLAIGGESGLIATDFATTDAGVPLHFLLFYSSSNKIDLGARVGFGNLDAAMDTLGLALLAAVRI